MPMVLSLLTVQYSSDSLEVSSVFEVGDRVEFVGEPFYSFDKVGNTGTVKEIIRSAVLGERLLMIDVDMKEPKESVFGKYWPYFVDEKLWERR